MVKAIGCTCGPNQVCDVCRFSQAWPEARVDIIGQNGNNGEHYAEQPPLAVTTFVCPECGRHTTPRSPEHTGINCHGCGANYLRDDNGVWQRQVKRAQQPLPAGHFRVTTTTPVDDDPLPEYVLKDPGGYTELASMLQAAFNQAAYGKGAERHANSKPFVEQPILKLCQMYGAGFAFGQAGKKMEEAQRMGKDAAVRELLGAIVYIAAAAIHIEQGGGDA